tara:strand:+ start:619 stop:1242 length:624 start_codon:yes stop_codon:yes gene_type:complete
MIHLIVAGKYENRESWPPIWEQCHQSIEKLGYPIKIWNNKKIFNELKSDDEYFYNEYLSKLDSVYKWDYVRYIILERYGGIYIDMDIEILYNFFPMLNKNKMYMMEGDIGELYNNCLMISPNNLQTQELWRTVRLFIKQKIIDNFELCRDKYNVMRMVGPFALSEWFAKYFSEFNLPKVGILSKYHFGQVDSDISFARHYVTSEWNK